MYELHYEEWDSESDSWLPMTHGFYDLDDLYEAANELRCSLNIRNITRRLK